VSRPPRGIRNHNPGNIRRSADRWKGLAVGQPDAAFFTFEAPLWGIRAMAVILRNYRRKYGLTTVAQIIRRWAPASENDTTAYIAAVAQAVGVKPSAELPADGDSLAQLVAAIIRHENGVQPYDATLIRQAVTLALA